MDLRGQARSLVRNLSCRIGASPYDIAWAARVPANLADGVRWPNLIDWLLEHQWPDGSWGGAIPYYHDRILCTLTAMIALREHGASAETPRAIRRAERYVWNHMHFLHHDPIELVGFELLLPTLLAEARMLELDVPMHSFGYGAIRAAKLRLLPVESLYAPGTSVTFSLEFLGVRGDPDRLARVVAENGAIACSPATTAYLLRQAGDHPRALGYLEEMLSRSEGIPHFHPYRTYELAWVLEHLAFGGLSLAQDGLVDAAVWRELKGVLARDGTSMDPDFGIKDGDTTAVVLHALALGGHDVDSEILRHFEDPNARIFRTFNFERNASVSTNAHALEVLALLPDYPNRSEVWNQIVTMLLAAQQYQSYWIDKWHASPYYATSHVLISLLRAQEPLVSECAGSIEWLVHMQREDGAWGYFGVPTLEETAYALLSLLHFHRRFASVDTAVLTKGASYLYRNGLVETEGDYPDLWIAKSLFAPKDVIRAAILAAILLYEETFGGIPH